MERTDKKLPRYLSPLVPKTIRVSVIYEKPLKKEVKTICISDLLEEFSKSSQRKVYYEHHIPFVRCLKVFFSAYFGGLIEPIFEYEAIDGLTQKEIWLIENFVKNHQKRE